MADPATYQVTFWLGHCEPEMRYVYAGNGDILCQSRVKRFDADGILTEVSEWETLSRLLFTKPEPAATLWKRIRSRVGVSQC